jgi:TolA-binding protein
MYHNRFLLALTMAAALLGAAPAAWAAPADDEYAAAAALYSSSQWREAADSFGRFIEQHADHERAAIARFYRGEALAQIGKYEEAAAEHDAFLTQQPQHALSGTARFRVGECLLLAGKGDAAKVLLEDFRREFPQDDLNALALPYLGEIALAAGKAADAEAHYTQALADYPSGPLTAESLFGLARCRQLGGKAGEAIKLYGQVAANPELSLADDASLQIGLMHYQARRFAEAEESLLAFRTTFASSDLAPQAWYWLGLSQQAAGRDGEAAETLAAAAKQFVNAPEAAALHAAAGDAFRRAGDPKSADSHYERLASQWPQSEWADDALLARSELALEAGQPVQAAAIAGDLAHRFPTSPHAALATAIRARGLIEEEKHAEAEVLLAPLVAAAAESETKNAASPTQAETTGQEIAYLLALAQAGQKKYEAALQTLTRLDALPAGDPLAIAAAEVRGSALLGLGQYAEVANLLQSRLKAQRSDPAAVAGIRAQLAVTHARLGDFAAARSQIEQLPVAAIADPDIAGAILHAAEAAYAANELSAAAKLFELISRDEAPAQQRSHALSGLAWTQFRLAGKQASAATFERLLQDYPESPLAAEAALVRARSLEDLKQTDAALATYRLVVEKYADSPHVPQALWGAARLHERLDQDREAAELLARLIEQHPDFAQRDAALYQLGWIRADLGDAAAADAAHDHLIKECPSSEYWADAAYRLAEQAARRQENDRAIELADQVLAAQITESQRESALYLRGQLAAAQGNWADTGRFMGQHAERFPQSKAHLSARYWQAEAAFRQNNFAAAEEQLAALESVIQTRRDAWLGIVPLRRAQCLAQQKRWPEALRLAQSVAKRYPQFPQLYDADYLCGRALGSLARFDEAREAYNRVLSAPAAQGTETAAMAQWMIGESYFHQKRYTPAVEAYQRCLADHAFPRWQAAALLQAGKCRLLQGDSEAARRDLARVVSDFADQPLVAEARSRLASLEPGESPAATTATRPNMP